MAREWKIGVMEGEGPLEANVRMPGLDQATWRKWGMEGFVTVREGRHVVEFDVPGRYTPGEGSTLVGDFVIRDRLYARFFEIRTPDGRRFPYCADLFDFLHEGVGLPLQPGSKPGEARVYGIGMVRDAWYDDASIDERLRIRPK